VAEVLAENVREAAARLGKFTERELMDIIDPAAYVGLKEIRRALTRFCKEGEVVRSEGGTYSYAGRKIVTKYAKMWRAMLIKERFSRQDIVRLTGASKIHAKKYFIFLRRSGFIESLTGQGYANGLFRLADPENAPLDHPRPRR
jgi:hypothetical protein